MKIQATSTFIKPDNRLKREQSEPIQIALLQSIVLSGLKYRTLHATQYLQSTFNPLLIHTSIQIGTLVILIC